MAHGPSSGPLGGSGRGELVRPADPTRTVASVSLDFSTSLTRGVRAGPDGHGPPVGAHHDQEELLGPALVDVVALDGLPDLDRQPGIAPEDLELIRLDRGDDLAFEVHAIDDVH